MKKFTAKAKRQQVKKAKKGNGSWTKRVVSVPGDYNLRGFANKSKEE